MAPPSDLPVPAPRRWLLASATLATQLLAILLFALALLWLVRLGDRSYEVIGLGVAGAAGVFAGGSAYRGSTAALVGCSVLDILLAVAGIAGIAPVRAVAVGPLAELGVTRIDLALAITGGVAAVAAAVSLLALPQARRFAAWHEQRIAQAARSRS